MEQDDRLARLARRISILTGLCVVSLLVSIATSLFLLRSTSGKKPAVYNGYYDSRTEPKRPVSAAETPENREIRNVRRTTLSEDPAKLIAESTAIVLSEYREDGDKLRSYTKEVLWVAPGVSFDYEPGDEIGYPHDIDRHTDIGEGQITFCKGDPARPKQTSNIYRGRIPAFDDIKVGKFIALVDAHRQKLAEEGKGGD